MTERMRTALSFTACLLAGLLAAGQSAAEQNPDRLPQGYAQDLWTSRVGAYLGPQYFLEREGLVQFSFGAEGHLRLVGPLAVGVALGMGVIADTSASGQASLRLHLLSSRKLSLGLDLRGGVLYWFSGEGSRMEPVFQGGLELAHDLGDSFWILVRAGLGWVPGDDRGVLADLVVGLGFFI